MLKSTIGQMVDFVKLEKDLKKQKPFKKLDNCTTDLKQTCSLGMEKQVKFLKKKKRYRKW